MQKTEARHPQNPSRATVQLVDDEVLVIRIIGRLLRDLGYEVVSSTDPVEVAESLRRDPNAFDLLITDFEMPQLNGHELIAQLREVRPDLPSIVLSGTLPNVADRIADRYLEKPCSHESLAGALKELIAAKAAS